MSNENNFGGIIKVIYSKTQNFTIKVCGYQTKRKELDEFVSSMFKRPITKSGFGSISVENIVGCVQWALDTGKFDWKIKRELKTSSFEFAVECARNVSASIESPFWIAELDWCGDWVTSSTCSPVDEATYLKRAKAIEGLATTTCVCIDNQGELK